MRFSWSVYIKQLEIIMWPMRYASNASRTWSNCHVAPTPSISHKHFSTGYSFTQPRPVSKRRASSPMASLAHTQSRVDTYSYMLSTIYAPPSPSPPFTSPTWPILKHQNFQQVQWKFSIILVLQNVSLKYKILVYGPQIPDTRSPSD